jgi:hypothetical protein
VEDNKLEIVGQLQITGRGKINPEDVQECARELRHTIIRMTMENVIEAVGELKAALRQPDQAKAEAALAHLDRALLGQI